MRRSRDFLRSRGGTAAIEFAIVVPVILLIIAGIVEIGRGFQVYSAVNRLATRTAISWADCSDTLVGVCSTELALYVTPAAIQNMAPQLTYTSSNPVMRMFEVTMSGTSATIVYAYPSSGTLSTTELSAAQTSIGSGYTGVVVTVTYTHNLLFFSSIMSSFLGSSRTVTYTVAQRKA